MSLDTICVVGVGGVGGYFGGRIAYEIARNPRSTRRIFFIARGRHLDAILDKGLILNSTDARGLVCRPSIATASVRRIPTPDLYLVCVKSYDLDAAVREMSRNIKSDTVVLPLLNGVDIRERIRRQLRKGIVLPACAYVGTHIEAPGVVTQAGGDGRILCGRDPQFPEYDPHDLITLFDEFGIKVTWYDDPYPAIWEKFVFIAAFGLVTASTGKTIGEVMGDPEATSLTRSIMEEIDIVAGSEGVVLPADIAELSLEKAKNFPPETKTSYQRDVEIPGKEDEGDLFGGTIIRMAQRAGLATPTTEYVYSSIQKRAE
jgi:2-dehydropantoate 2-reductase